MDKKKAKQEAFRIIDEYRIVLDDSARRTFVIPESRLPYSKQVIKNAIKVALLNVDDEDKKESLKSSYISLGNFVSDDEAKRAEEISMGLFPFINMDGEDKKVFLRERFESGLLGDYELAIQISKNIADEQRRLKKEIDDFLF
jgi:hypothetical protein